MYGFSGYGTNEYATRRLFASGPIVKLAMTVFRNTYNLAKIVRLLFRNTNLEL